MTDLHKNLVVETAEQKDVWMVTPTPGYVIKFKEVVRIGHSEKNKGFINVCHCTQLPPPTDDIDEDELASRLDKGDYSFRIPLSVGELDCVLDKEGKSCFKVDVLVNSVFFEKRLAPKNADFYRHFLCMVLCEAIEGKHNLVLNPNDGIRLNRTKMGDIGPMRIYKRPPVPVVQELAKEELPETSHPQVFVESAFKTEQPKNVKIRLLGGKQLEISLGLDGIEPPVKNVKRLRAKLGVDRVVLLLDNERSLFDFCIPFNIDPSAARSKLLLEKNSLAISAPVVFP